MKDDNNKAKKRNESERNKFSDIKNKKVEYEDDFQATDKNYDINRQEKEEKFKEEGNDDKESLKKYICKEKKEFQYDDIPSHNRRSTIKLDEEASFISKKFDINYDNKNNPGSRYGKYSKYSDYDTFNNRRDNKEKNISFVSGNISVDTSRISKEGKYEFEVDKYKYKSLSRTNNIDHRNKSQKNADDDICEENESLINKISSLKLKLKNLEISLQDSEEKNKNLEIEIEKFNDMDNHYLSIIREKDENISNLNRKIAQLEKEDVKNINFKISVFKNLKLFFLNNIKNLKISEDVMQRYLSY